MLKTAYWKKVFILIFVEFIIIITMITRSLLDKSYSQTFDASRMGTAFRQYSENDEGLYIDAAVTGNKKAVLLVTNDIPLDKGIYDITVEYKTNTDVNDCIVYDINDTKNFAMPAAVSNTVKLIDTSSIQGEYTTITFRIWLNRNVENFRIKVNYNGKGYLYVKSIDVNTSNVNGVYNVLKWILLFGIFDGIVIYCIKCREKSLRGKSVNWIAPGIVMVVLLASLPLAVDYLVKGHDLEFHLLRIAGIAESLENGQFPVRMQPNWLEGYGYPVSIFYGDILLYIPAVLYLIGMPLQLCYKFFVILINMGTMLISYICFRQMFHCKKTAFMGAMVYTLSPYRLTDLYIRAAIGEYCAMMFLPLILYAFWCLFALAKEEKEYKNGYLYLAVGLSGILQTHLITCILVAFFIFIFIVLQFKKVFFTRRIKELIKAFGVWVMMNLWFLVPLLNYMSLDLSVNNTTKEISYIQARGAYIYQLFASFLPGNGLGAYISAGVIPDMPQSVGVIGLLILVVAAGIILLDAKKNKKTLGVTVLFLVISLYMCTYLFPYDAIQRNIPWLCGIVETIQFPWRFLTLATAFLAVVFCQSLLLLKDGEKNWIERAYAIAVIGGTLISALYLNDMIIRQDVYRVYNAQSLDTNEVIGGEYLYSGTDVGKFDNRIHVAGDLSVSNYRKKGNTVVMEVSDNNEGGNVTIPVLYYPGYYVTNEVGEHIEHEEGKNQLMQINIPPQYIGEITVEYNGMWYWKVFDIISLGFIVSGCIYLFVIKSEGKFWKTGRKMKYEQR